MLFNSYEFIFLFLPITFLGYFTIAKFLKKDLAILWLVFASLFFYAWWDYKYVPLLLCSIAFNYIVGKKIENEHNKKFWLIFGLTINILLLGYYKYMDFFLVSINQLLNNEYFNLKHIVLPLGISFFTFTQSAYLVDAYRGETKNHNFITYCEFVTIFPHLIAGPIINHKEMIPQFINNENFKINYKNLALGITIFIFGLFKKIALADKLAPFVESIYSNATNLSFLEAWIGAIGYTFQLYFDFSAYSEMAIGLALMFNLKFPINFNSPYKATSIIDFWRRWHMTLGLWVKNYLYIPMGGNKFGYIKQMRNLFLSMSIIGLWHGAGWTFIFWGAAHGAALVINHSFRRFNINLPKFLSWIMTFIFVMICWIFFRASSFTDAIAILHSMTNVNNIVLPNGKLLNYLGFLQNYGIIFSQEYVSQISFTAALRNILISSIILFLPNPLVLIKSFKPNKKWLLLIIILFIYSIINLTNYSEFLYFQF